MGFIQIKSCTKLYIEHKVIQKSAADIRLDEGMDSESIKINFFNETKSS